MKPPHYGGNSWADNRPKIRLSQGSGYDRRVSDPYQQPGVWDAPTHDYGRSSSWHQAANWQEPKPRGFDSFGGSDSYYSQGNAPLSSNYYNSYEPTPPMARYGEYGLNDSVSQNTPASYDYGYDRNHDNFVSPPKPQPLFAALSARRSGSTSTFFSGSKHQKSYVPPPKSARTATKRPHEASSKKKQPNVKIDNGNKNGKSKENVGEPDEKQLRNDARFLFEKHENAAELLEKCATLGESRHRQFRYKLYRILNTLGLDFVTITEQQGTYAKSGTLRMKVTLKNFFPQYFFGEASGTEYEHTCYDASVMLALRLNKMGLLSCEAIAMFYHKKMHYKPEKFDAAKANFKLLVDEISKHEFTANFKEGKIESEPQMAVLDKCVKTVAERIRNAKQAENPESAEAKSAEATAINADASIEVPKESLAEADQKLQADAADTAKEPVAAEETSKPQSLGDAAQEIMECTDEA